MMLKVRKLFKRRASRVRYRVRCASGSRLRFSVFRSNNNIYAQIIDDSKGNTLVSASTLDDEVKKEISYGGNIFAASIVGRVIAERAMKAGVGEVVFDRGGYQYHGRIKALATSARSVGLRF